MPGLSFAFQREFSAEMPEKFKRLIKETECLEGFTSQILFTNEQSVLGITRSFSDYPFVKFENDRYQIWLEGKVYGHSTQQVKDTLFSICESIFDREDYQPIVRWQQQADGDFVIYSYDKINRNWAIYGDILAKLPMYYADDKTFILSRDLHFVRNFSTASSLDRQSLAEFMLFGYILQGRTWFQGIRKIPPATLVRISGESGNIRMTPLRQFNYERKKHRFRSASNNAKQLAELWAQACKNLAASGPLSVLRLSGGYDSRAIAVGLKQSGVRFLTESFLEKDHQNQLDYETARQVAEMLEVPWNGRTIDNCSGEDVNMTFKLKAGLTSFESLYSIRFIRILSQTYGNNVIVYNGLSGDKFMPDIRPKVPLYTRSALLDYVIKKDSLWSLKDIEALMGISQSKLMNTVQEVLCDYPEKSLKQKYVHWKIHERCMSRFFESNDRGHFFSYVGTPFLNPAFYEYAMNCPDSQKTGLHLYTLMLKELCPEILTVPYARNFATTLEPVAHYADKDYHRKMKFHYWAYTIQKSPNPLRYIYRKLKKTKRVCPKINLQAPKENVVAGPLVECLKQQVQRPEIAQYFSRSHLDTIVENPQRYSNEALNLLFTVLTVIEEFHGIALTLNDYQDRDWYSD